MDGFGFNPRYPSDSTIGSTEQSPFPEDFSDASGEYHSQLPPHQPMSLKKELARRSVGMPSSVMTSRYARIYSGIAELTDAIRGLGYALLPKEPETLRAFLMLLDSSHAGALAQNLDELMVSVSLPASDQESLRTRVSSVRTELQSAGENEDFDLNDAQNLYSRIKADLMAITKILETMNTSSHSEKAAVLGAMNHIQAIESQVVMLTASAQGDFLPMVTALEQMQMSLEKVELGLNSLNPVDIYGIVSGSADETVIEMPPCGKPELSPPQVCDLQRSVLELRMRTDVLKQELRKKEVKLQLCNQQVAGIINSLGALAKGTAALERATLEVQEKARKPISFALVSDTLSQLSATGFNGLKKLLTGMLKLFSRGQARLISVCHCCSGFSRLLPLLTSGLMWFARGIGQHAGTALLTPVFMVKRFIVEEAPPWWYQPLPDHDFSFLPEGMEIYNPLENTVAFEEIYRYLEGGEIFDETPVFPERYQKEIRPSDALSPTTSDHSSATFADELQMHEESLQQLEAELSGRNMGAVMQADERLTSCQLEMVRLGSEYERLNSQLSESMSKSCRTTMDSCKRLMDSCESLAPSYLPGHMILLVQTGLSLFLRMI